MKNLRRISLLLAVIMALSMLLTACGNTPDETHETTAGEQTTASDGTDAPATKESETTLQTSPVEKTTAEETSAEETTAEATDATETAATETSETETDSEAVTDENGGEETNESTTLSETDEKVTDDAETTENKENETLSEEEKHKLDRFNKEYAPVFYLGPKDIADAAKPYEWGDNDSYMLGGYLSEDKTYVTLIPFDGEPEARFYLFQSSTEVGPIMVIKYRARVAGHYMEFFMNSTTSTAQPGDSFHVGGMRYDNEWDVKIIDLREKLGDSFDGKKLGHIRFDFSNGNPIPEMAELDVEYIGFFKTVEDAQKFEYGEGYQPPQVDDGKTDEKAELYFNATDIYDASVNNAVKNLAESILSGDLSYVTLKAENGKPQDAYIQLLTSPKKAAPYFAIKYRTTSAIGWVELFMDSVNSGATGGSSIDFYPIDDGEWHVAVINVTEELGAALFNGETVNYIRFDFANSNTTLGDWSLDVEYIGFYATEDDAMGEDYDPNAPVNIFDAEDIKNAIDTKNNRVESAILSEDKDYVSVNMKVGSVDATCYLFTTKTAAGRYMAVKYRTESTGFYSILWMGSNTYTAGEAKMYIENIQTDGEWQYYIVDLNEKLGDKFNGESLGHFRFDFFHMGGDKASTEVKSMDVGYVAFFDSLEAAEAYAGIGGEELPEETAHFEAQDILEASQVDSVKNLASATLSTDGTFVTLSCTEGGSADAYINLLTTPKKAAPYFAIKYRTTSAISWVEFFMDSVNSGATGGSNFNFKPITDGEWHIYVVNAVDKLGAALFNGQVVNYIRFDFANCNDTLGAWSIDVEYIGFFENESDAYPADRDENAPVTVLDAEDIKTAIDTKNSRVESATVSAEKDYVTVNMGVGNVDATCYLFTTKTAAGRYMVIKYRTESTGFYSILWMGSNTYTAGEAKMYIENIQTNGEWQYYIVDLNEKLGEKFDGESLGHFRFDFIHMGGDKASTEVKSMDVGYVAFFTSMEAAEAYIAK